MDYAAKEVNHMNGLTTAAMDMPRSSGEARANFTVREAENGFIAMANTHSQIPYKRNRAEMGDYLDNYYANGNSGEFVYPTLEEAFKDAEKILNLAKTALQADIDRFNKSMEVPTT